MNDTTRQSAFFGAWITICLLWTAPLLALQEARQTPVAPVQKTEAQAEQKSDANQEKGSADESKETDPEEPEAPQQGADQEPAPRIRVYENAAAFAQDVDWRCIGPANHSGRIIDLAVDPRDDNVWYVASASGGVWKTANRGMSFKQIFGQTQPCTIGDISLDPSRPDIVWVGTGEANNQRSSYWGDGVYKSTDAGKTWTNVGLPDSHHIARIVVDPSNGERVFVAALGHLYSPNEERGLFLTEDGGRTWKCVLHAGPDVGVVDVAIQPGQPMVVLAATYERRRRAWHFDGAGPGSAVWRSEDAGNTWNKLASGLPSGEIGRIGIDWSESKPDTVFLTVSNQNERPVRRRIVEPIADVRAVNRAWERERMAEWDVLLPEEAEEEPSPQAGSKSTPIGGEIYRSDDAGKSWTKVSTQDVGGTPAYYYGQIRVDPSNAEKLYVLSVPLWVSDDGGKNFRRDGAERIHVDHHALWIDPKNGRHLLLGNDGGLYESWDGGKHWIHFENLPVGQYYAVGVDLAEPYRVYGGTQDNGSWCIPSVGPTAQGIRIEDCFKVSGGDGFFCQLDPEDDNIVYSEYQFGGLLRTDLRTMRSRGIRPRPAKGEPPLRFNWMSPLLVSRHAKGTIYYGANRLFKSTNRGDDWTAVSGDLTTADPAKIAGNVPHCTITMIAESPRRAGLLWVGTDDGKLWMTADDGQSWQDLTSKFPAAVRKLWVSRIVASQHAEGRCFVTYTGYREDHFAPYVFVTEDYGLTWRAIQGDLPDTHPVNVLAESPRNPDVLFAGTESGAYVSLERGGQWHRLGALPQVAVHDLVVHPRARELVIGTHGLGIHITDIAPFEDASSEKIAKGAALVTPPDIVRLPPGADGGYTVLPRQWRGENPGRGARLGAWIPAGAKEPKLLIRDLRGETLVTVDLREESGLHLIDWNGMTGARGTGGGLLERIGRRMSRARARPLGPGEYRLELEIGGKTVEKKPFAVR